MGFESISKNVAVDTCKVDVPLHAAAATSWRPSASRPTLITFGIKIHNNGLSGEGEI